MFLTSFFTIPKNIPLSTWYGDAHGYKAHWMPSMCKRWCFVWMCCGRLLCLSRQSLSVRGIIYLQLFGHTHWPKHSSHRVEAPITWPLKRFCAKPREVQGGAKFSRAKRLKLGGLQFFGYFIWSQKLVWTHYECPEYCHNISFSDEFLLTLALKTRDMCHGTIESLMIS